MSILATLTSIQAKLIMDSWRWSLTLNLKNKQQILIWISKAKRSTCFTSTDKLFKQSIPHKLERFNYLKDFFAKLITTLQWTTKTNMTWMEVDVSASQMLIKSNICTLNFSRISQIEFSQYLINLISRLKWNLLYHIPNNGKLLYLMSQLKIKWNSTVLIDPFSLFILNLWGQIFHKNIIL